MAANEAFAALAPGAGRGTSFLDVHGDPSRVRMQMALLSTTGGETVVVEAPATEEGRGDVASSTASSPSTTARSVPSAASTSAR